MDITNECSRHQKGGGLPVALMRVLGVHVVSCVVAGALLEEVTKPAEEVVVLHRVLASLVHQPEWP